MNKICVKCLIELPVNLFGKKQKKLQSYCKPCLYSYQMKRWELRKQKAVFFKGGECSLCGYSKNFAALHFHHKDPEHNLFDWNKLRLHAWSTVVAELDKCILLCSNCHAELHYPQQMVRTPGIEPGSED